MQKQIFSNLGGVFGNFSQYNKMVRITKFSIIYILKLRKDLLIFTFKFKKILCQTQKDNHGHLLIMMIQMTQRLLM